LEKAPHAAHNGAVLETLRLLEAQDAPQLFGG
jgi:hypothetical protein